jgi:glycosyltransferase involved in cell wall biosynthesis
MLGLGVPSKSYNIMAAGKPILIVADRNSEISLIVSEHNLGWIVEPNNPEKLSEAFTNIYLEYLANGFEKFKPREIAIKYFAKDKILDKYSKLFNS